MKDFHGIKIDEERDNLLTKQAKDLLEGYYMKEGETYQEALARPALAFCEGDKDFAQRIYNYASNLWFMYASPVLSNAPAPGKKTNAMPISCFLSYIPDTITGQMDASKEIAALSVAGGGVGLHNGIRAVSDKAPGPIPYMKTVDAAIGYYRQSRTRKGSAAYYMDIDHPDIREHIKFRVPTGGDSARKADNRKSFHNAVNITKKFIEAVNNDSEFELKCPATGEVREKVKARGLWEEILETRVLTGEPYLHFIDVANEHLPQELKDKNLTISGSNLCCEIELPTSEDRTAVCCLSSVNLEKYDEWKDTQMVKDLVRFLDNVISYFIENAPSGMEKAVYSASRERSIGIGAMGFHGCLMSKSIPWESGGFNSAVQHNNIMFKHIKEQALEATKELAVEKGEAPDMEGSGKRNAHLMAIAPNANSSIICNCTASIEPVNSNAYPHTTRAGTYLVKNKWLDKLFREKSNDEDLIESWWDQVIREDGSVQNLDCLDSHEKEVYKTSWELDQHWVVQHAEDRQEYVCQSQSVNLFFPSGSDEGYINSVHLKAARGGKLKGLYYLRTQNKQNTDTVREIQRQALEDWNDLEECVSCQG